MKVIFFSSCHRQVFFVISSRLQRPFHFTLSHWTGKLCVAGCLTGPPQPPFWLLIKWGSQARMRVKCSHNANAFCIYWLWDASFTESFTLQLPDKLLPPISLSVSLALFLLADILSLSFEISLALHSCLWHNALFEINAKRLFIDSLSVPWTKPRVVLLLWVKPKL